MARYHPLYDGVWNDDKLEGATFEEHAFFVFLFGNTRQRPSGIYRATDEQLAADTTVPVKRVAAYLADLHRRGVIVRDGGWIFVRGYLRRQPKQDRLLLGVQVDIAECSSALVLTAFSERYPIYSRWSTDRLVMVNNPLQPNVPSEQLQSSSSYRAVTEQSRAEQADSERLAPPTLTSDPNGNNPTPGKVTFRINDRILSALNRAPMLGQVPRLRDPLWWQAELRANPGVALADEVLKAEAWLRTNPQRAPRKDTARFFHNWLARADRRAE